MQTDLYVLDWNGVDTALGSMTDTQRNILASLFGIIGYNQIDSTELRIQRSMNLRAYLIMPAAYDHFVQNLVVAQTLESFLVSDSPGWEPFAWT
uniref:Uncharacterized protein n=1 Tax=Candidatus Kentrum sp. MB TaxID=2138164 RepID=A0A450XZ85_9GAMM|nr:MAG: hypothetical protein BECKMB1821G_GA0114241_11049 [Candidatus Kentron sp. MB]VFK34608.1 MAG: hypothetical protein BECKMB1821I_GA0114274_107717 [Candidatus Kentron sp. MB]VFK76856.1 MAG: hypothetical protein BECKMB1821H_GA0114242_10797 [Candidatus Kentron sp. MB]